MFRHWSHFEVFLYNFYCCIFCSYDQGSNHMQTHDLYFYFWIL